MTKGQRFSLLVAVAAGVTHGLVAWIAFGAAKALPSMAFLLGVPLGMGATSLFFSDEAQVRWYQRLILFPWLVLLTFGVLLVAILHEGAACLLVLALPIISMVMLGTIIATKKATPASVSKRPRAVPSFRPMRRSAPKNLSRKSKIKAESMNQTSAMPSSLGRSDSVIRKNTSSSDSSRPSSMA